MNGCHEAETRGYPFVYVGYSCCTEKGVVMERMRSTERGGWIFGLVLIGLGAIFMLQNAGLPVLVGNWWALFILMPAIASFAAAWTAYQADGQVSSRVVGLLTVGLVPLTIALVFLFNFDFGTAWPVLLVVLGVGMLLRGNTTDTTDRPAEVSS